MEDRNFDPAQDPETTDDKPSEKKRRQGSFLADFLSKQRELLSGKTEIDDDDEEESSEKPKKWRRSFKDFFKNIVPPPESEPRTDTKAPESGFLDWAGLEQAASEAQAQRQADSESTYQADPLGVAAEYQTPLYDQSEPQGVSSEVQSEIPDATAPDDIEFTQPLVEMQREVPQTAEIPNAREQTIDLPMDQTESTMYINERAQQFIAQQDREAPFIPQKERQAGSQPVVERERVIERNVGAALPIALVGAEYLGRKSADRKISKTVAETTGELKKDAERAAYSHNQLENLVKQNQTQLEALKQDRGITSIESNIPNLAPAERATTLPVPEIIPIPTAIVEAKLEPKEVLTETSVHPSLERINEQVEQRPVQILEKVAEAAENDVPVERVFERSHEVKDDKSFVTTASSVGSIMSANASRQNASYSQQYVQRSSSTQSFDGLPIINDAQTPEMYKQAMQFGFGAALAIIVFGILAYVMVK